jgi:hypothetical protein
MKALLQAIKSRLENQLNYIKKVHYLVDEDLLPAATGFPCIGLKDGNISYEQYAAEGIQKIITEVRVIVYQEILRPEAPVMGYGNEKGVLEIAADVKAALDNYKTLGSITNIVFADLISEEASETMGSEAVLIQKKGLTMRYEQHSDL